MAKGFDTLQDIAVKKQTLETFIKGRRQWVRCFSFVKGHISKTS
jgi:hypothetical protein